MHQLLAIALPFLIWLHLAPHANIIFFLFLFSFPTALLIQLGILLYTNSIGRSTKGRKESVRDPERSNASEADAEGEATIVNLTRVVNERLSEELVKHQIIRIDLRPARPIRVKEGQYIGLWIPAVSTYSFLQVHPFMVASWSDGHSDNLRVFLEPRRGWTKKVVEYMDRRDETQCRALFTGPYGVSVPTRKYGIVLLVASDFGIVAHFSYLKQLIYNYNARRAHTRRLRLVWQVETSGTSMLYLPKYSCLLV